MGSINKIILLGYVGKDPEVKNTPGGSSVANFSLATNESWKDKSGEKQEKTEWHKIVAWGKLADLAMKYLKKGKQIYLEGKIQTRKYTDKENVERYTTEIVASQIVFLGSGGKEPGQDDF